MKLMHLTLALVLAASPLAAQTLAEASAAAKARKAAKQAEPAPEKKTFTASDVKAATAETAVATATAPKAAAPALTGKEALQVRAAAVMTEATRAHEAYVAALKSALEWNQTRDSMRSSVWAQADRTYQQRRFDALQAYKACNASNVAVDVVWNETYKVYGLEPAWTHPRIPAQA